MNALIAFIESIIDIKTYLNQKCIYYIIKHFPALHRSDGQCINLITKTNKCGLMFLEIRDQNSHAYILRPNSIMTAFCRLSM